jgi:hypothetical protein
MFFYLPTGFWFFIKHRKTWFRKTILAIPGKLAIDFDSWPYT